MTHLFDPLTLRGVTLANRIGVSPMCMYCCDGDGKPTDWHLAHLLQRAIGGAGMVMAEATAVTADGRITPGDLGLWEDAQLPGHVRLAQAIARAGSVPAIQIGHAGRKGSRLAQWLDGPADPSWETVSASAIPMGDFAAPRAMTEAEILALPEAFAACARRAVAAGYRLIELHGAHGYLLHQFLSPLSNRRNDRWGGDFEGRTRLTLAVIRAVREAVPEDMPLSLRVSHTDWAEGGWTTEETVELARRAKAAGIDLLDVSSGGIDPSRQKIPIGPGYQVPGAQAVREGAGVAVAAVGMITEPEQAQAIVAEGKADLVLLARAVLRDPYWPIRAAAALGRPDAVQSPPQYERGWNAIAKLRMRMETAEPMPPL
ncbi:NADH:flavin oxidoreductase/NADH oxidase [Falsiroseomonas oryzae]|uniref:NADH:flavin oxidoreductase/NADH oxidase n=1 Tax=Falsiroseomonas oryzae TaxID=2766473 RepID=UPI0022EB8895|nr:NADH:flavin oxidoreductase/NADH oxidase [Roseomonas sp. MO-31]